MDFLSLANTVSLLCVICVVVSLLVIYSAVIYKIYSYRQFRKSQIKQNKLVNDNLSSQIIDRSMLQSKIDTTKLISYQLHKCVCIEIDSYITMINEIRPNTRVEIYCDLIISYTDDDYNNEDELNSCEMTRRIEKHLGISIVDIHVSSSETNMICIVFE